MKREEQNNVLSSFDIGIGGRRKFGGKPFMSAYHFIRVNIKNLKLEFYNLKEEIFFI